MRIDVEVQVGTHPYVRYWPGQNEVVSQRPLGSGVTKLLGKTDWVQGFDTAPSTEVGSNIVGIFVAPTAGTPFLSPAPMVP